MKMKKLVALLLALTLIMATTVAFADTYTIESLEIDLELPSGMEVTNYVETDEEIVITLSYESRTDCQYQVRITYNEAYEEYWIPSMPEEMINELVAYYDAWYEGEFPAECDTEVGMISSTGLAADGYQYATYVYIYGGLVFETTGGIAATAWDEAAFQANFELAWQVMLMVENAVA